MPHLLTWKMKNIQKSKKNDGLLIELKTTSYFNYVG